MMGMPRHAAAALVVALSLSLASSAFAQAEDARTHVADVNGYDVDFTLPTAAKAGCLVCHGDENLVRLTAEGVVSYYVDAEELDAGPHAGVQCAGCHIDFAFTAPHARQSEDWESVARSACKNCHQDQNRDYGAGVHRGDVTNGERVTDSDDDAVAVPLCGDCHGGHDIVTLTDDPEGQLAMHVDGWNVCGRCHEDYWESYRDYYHGRAYHRGAPDAPACWDCHGYHDIYPSSDRRSMVHSNRLADTCGACHLGDVNEGYLEYAELIHGQRDILEENPLFSLVQRVRSAIVSVLGG